MKKVSMAAAVVAATVGAVAVLGQLGGGGDTKEAVATRGAGKPVEVVTPVVDKAVHSVSLPAEFWNEHLTDWVEVAVCGRPSDFLHETIVCVTTTKTLLEGAMREAGFEDADAWVANVADFPRVRGDRALILLEVERAGKKETYTLDELLVYQGWGVSIGPFGWMFKGEPGDENAKLKTQNAKPGEAQGGAAEGGMGARERILRDDPQVALQFRGLQHLSRSFVDHPLCYDTWIYPNLRYFRNAAVLPAEVYNSNGDVPVRMTIQKVGDAELLRQCAKNWHDPAYAKYMLEQLPIAEQIDQDKRDYRRGYTDLAARMKATTDATVLAMMKKSAAYARVALAAAAVEKGYAALDAAWVNWACDHAKWETTDAGEIKEMEKEKTLWREHMQRRKERADWLWQAEDASQMKEMVEGETATRRVAGAEMEMRGKALLAENEEGLTYWREVKGRTAADDPRKDWLRHINLQVGLAESREEAGKAEVALGQVMEGGGGGGLDLATAQGTYQRALRKSNVAVLQLQLADVEFEITKREGMEGDPDMPALMKRRDALQAQLKTMEAGTQPGNK